MGRQSVERVQFLHATRMVSNDMTFRWLKVERPWIATGLYSEPSLDPDQDIVNFRLT
jgi:hypothetical protein